MRPMPEDRYEVLDVIGAGGMATVWRARDRALDRIVALKRPHPAPPGSPAHTRFDREARIAAAVDHPNLISVYDVGHDAQGPYLVMEYVDGPSLATAPQAPGDAARIGSEIAAALAALHAAGIVHRDVKPGNVLLAPGGAKLTDFGIARHADTVTLTQPGLVHATPAYAAPEVLAGGEQTAASDVYSAAVVVAELLTGDRRRVATLPTAWQAALAPALASDPTGRPSAAEFAATLRAQADRPAATALPPTVAWTTMPVPGARDHGPPRRTAGTAIVAFLVLALVGALVVALAVRDGDSAEPDASLAPGTTAGTAPAATSVVPAAATVAPAPATTAAVAVTTLAPTTLAPTTLAPTTAPAPTSGPPASVTADTPDGTRQLILRELDELDALNDRDRGRVDQSLTEAIRFAEEGRDQKSIETRLSRAADLIDEAVDRDSEPWQLLEHLVDQLGVARDKVFADDDD